ncbi:LysR family transcriptional regulator [Methylobrevis albus]|uniref:LysR family transcriptional regulator n=1 Tax=Methylobrevis albus TaxID=2793297 RepID=A0A931MZM9_9HYPH|nr:LysR substrate-binding domain-containing protein [Methylobrevis albus]MBH0238254.1 LysR family transcriptional regulator [Methylobrevis albus]
MQHLDTEALAVFVAVVDAGGFTAAATRLAKTQSAVSVALSRFEQRLGEKLIDRSRRELRLTPAGELLIGPAREMLAIEGRALATLQGDRLRGRVLVGMPDDYLGVFGPKLIEGFTDENPGIRTEILCDFSTRLEKLVATGEIDIAVITRERAGETGDYLRRERLVWVAPPDRPLERERPLPLALFPETCRARPHVIEALARAGRSWRLAWTSSHLPSIQSAIALGKAVTALPASVVPPGLRIVEDDAGLPPLPPVELAVITGDAPRAPVRRLRRFLLTEFCDQPAAAAANAPASSEMTPASWADER